MQQHLAAIGSARPRHGAGASLRRGLASLGRAWTLYTIERAIADVDATTAAAYRDFGLDKAEMLSALSALRDELKRAGRLPAEAWAAKSPLAIAVTCRKPAVGALRLHDAAGA